MTAPSAAGAGLDARRLEAELRAALAGMAAQRALLERIGLEVHMPDSGCCGMAGAFDLMADKYAVSLACAERVLLPAVRALGPDALIVADGFSCAEQISRSGGRQALHSAQVLHMALRQHENRHAPTAA